MPDDKKKPAATRRSTGVMEKRVGARIRAWRKERGLTIQGLCDKAGIPNPGTLGSIESGRAWVGGDRLLEIAADLEVPAAALLAGNQLESVAIVETYRRLLDGAPMSVDAVEVAGINLPITEGELLALRAAVVQAESRAALQRAVSAPAGRWKARLDSAVAVKAAARVLTPFLHGVTWTEEQEKELRELLEGSREDQESE